MGVQRPRHSSPGCHEDEPLGYVCEARGIGVTHMPDNLAKSGVIERSCVKLFEIWREGCYSKSCVHSRTFLEVSVLAGALCAADQRGDKLRAYTPPSRTAEAAFRRGGALGL